MRDLYLQEIANSRFVNSILSAREFTIGVVEGAGKFSYTFARSALNLSKDILIVDFANPLTQTYQGARSRIDERVNQATNVLFIAWDFYKYAASESATLVFSDPSGEAYKEASARLDHR